MIEYRGLKNSFTIDGLPSLGLLEQNSYPDSIEIKDGYYLANYGGNWMGMFKTRLMTEYRIGLVGWRRDIFFLLLGTTAALVFTNIFKKK